MAKAEPVLPPVIVKDTGSSPVVTTEPTEVPFGSVSGNSGADASVLYATSAKAQTSLLIRPVSRYIEPIVPIALPPRQLCPMENPSNPTRFPPVSAADESGLLAVGGRLGPDWLLEAYRSAIFPWPIVDGALEMLAWFSPDPRAILPLDSLHVSRRLARRIRQGRFSATCNQAFEEVVAGCQAPRQVGDQTWITPAMARAYQRLHELGHAHSVEIWRDQKLVGGVYGVAIGGAFSGESMFHRIRDASKAALYFLVAHLKSRGYVLFDVQQTTPHMVRMGSVEISRTEFLRRLQAAQDLPVSFGKQLETSEALGGGRSGPDVIRSQRS